MFLCAFTKGGGSEVPFWRDGIRRRPDIPRWERAGAASLFAMMQTAGAREDCPIAVKRRYFVSEKGAASPKSPAYGRMFSLFEKGLRPRLFPFVKNRKGFSALRPGRVKEDLLF